MYAFNIGKVLHISTEFITMKVILLERRPVSVNSVVGPFWNEVLSDPTQLKLR